MEPERDWFAGAAEGYDRLMGRYLPTLGPAFADAAGVAEGERVLDVGCGPGGLTRVLLERVGDSGDVAAIDPSDTFVAACRQQNPAADLRQGVAEQLPWDDATFDAALASLVVGFMSDPLAGASEMWRVTRAGGRVAACFWTLDDMPLLEIFWRAVDRVVGPGPGEADRSERLGRRQGELAGLLADAGLDDVEETVLRCTGRYDGFEDWWSSFTGGAGPAGAYQESMGAAERERVREVCQELLGRPDGPFSLEASAWCAVGMVPG